MKTTNVWILRDAKSIKAWIQNCVVFNTENELKVFCKVWKIVDAEVYLDSELKYKISNGLLN